MREVLYEESAQPSNLKMQRVLYVMYSIFLWISIVASIFLLMLFLWDWGILFFLVFTVGSSVLLAFLRKKIYYCVDLIFVSGSTRVVKVINYKKRKKIIIFEAKDVIQVGKITSESFAKVYATPNIKKLYATPNRYLENGFYVYLKQDGQDYVVILECKETYLQHLVAFTGRQVIEKDYK